MEVFFVFMKKINVIAVHAAEVLYVLTIGVRHEKQIPNMKAIVCRVL